MSWYSTETARYALRGHPGARRRPAFLGAAGSLGAIRAKNGHRAQGRREQTHDDVTVAAAEYEKHSSDRGRRSQGAQAARRSVSKPGRARRAVSALRVQ